MKIFRNKDKNMCHKDKERSNFGYGIRIDPKFETEFIFNRPGRKVNSKDRIVFRKI